MNATQLPFLVTGILVLITILLGHFLQRKGKPYGKVKLGFHLFFALWLTTGYGFIASVFVPANTKLATGIAFGVMGLALVTQLATGAALVFRKQRGKGLTIVHAASAVVLFLADVCALVFSF